MNLKIKKLISLILSLLMILTAMPLCVFSADGPMIKVSSTEAKIGDTVSVNISIDNNPGIVNMMLDVSYDDEMLKLIEVVDGGILGSEMHTPVLTLNPYRLTWANDTATSNITSNGVIVTLIFAVSDNVNVENTEIFINYDNNNYDIVNLDFETVDFNTEKGILTFVKEKTSNSIDDFDYEITDDGIVITGYKGTETDVIIGESYEIDGTTYNVVEIAESAFEANEDIKSVVIPATVEVIGDYAFYDCTSLVSVTVLGKETTIGEIALGYYYISRREDGVVEGFTIYGYEGSTAEAYAAENEGITFVALEEAPEECTHKGGTANCVDKAVCELCGESYGDVDSNNHKTVVIYEAVAPDCENTGLTEGSHCSACDTVIVEQEIVAKLGHNFTEYVETVDYTCDKDGYDIYKCSRCDATENKNFTDAACRPEADYTVIEKASCDKAGYKAILCSECKEEIETETIAKREHSIVDTTVATKATCLTEGVMNQKCDCAETEEYEACTYTTTRAIPVDAENHEGEADVIKNAKDATCYAEGYTGDTYWSCCDVLYSKGKATDKIAHTPADAVRENEVAATCYKVGSYDEVVYCSIEDCKHEISRETKTIEKTAHTPAVSVRENEVAATCYKAGSYDEVVYCSVEDCKYEISRTEKIIEKTAHTPAEAVEENRIEATCAVDGSYDEVVYCSVKECKLEISRETRTIFATGEHNYATEVEDSRVPSTCKTVGKVTMKCGCGATKEVTLELDATNHETVVADNAVAPDCENTGLTEGSHCSACNTVIVAQETVDRLGHDFTVFVETVDYTCDKDGYDVYKCSRCDATENKNFTDAACRPESDYTVIEKASCDKAGYKAILCSICKEELETETIAKREHNIVDTTVATKATCLTEGFMNQKCDCAETDEYEACTYTTTRAIPVDENNHEGKSNVVKNAKEATCYLEGYTGDTYWSCCDALYAKGEATEKIAHTPAVSVRENEKPASCGAEGSYEEVVYCSVEACKYEISREIKTIPATGEHNYATEVESSRVPSTCKTAGKVTMKCGCGATKDVALELDAANHETVVTDKAVAPTCEATGLTEGSHCSACDTVIVEQEIVAKLGHNFTEYVETVDYTCYKDGYDIYKCSRCDATEKKNFTDAACRPEADYTVIEKASCDKAGYKAILCSECKEEIETETIAKREHSIVDTTVATKATCLTEGVMNQKCDCAETEEYEACTYTATRAIPVDAENHKSTDTEIKNIKTATCTEEGYTGDECYVCCGAVKVAGTKTEKVAHTEEIIPAVESSCTQTGLTEGKKCSVCGEILVAQKKIEKTAHIEEIIPAVEPDCVNGGFTEGVKCILCGEILAEQEIVDALGHSYSVVSTEYDTDGNGTVIYRCTVCAEEKIEEVTFDINSAFELIDKAEEKLADESLSDAQKEDIEEAKVQLEAFIERYVVYDEEGNIVENNIPFEDNEVMTEYHKLLLNLDNAVYGNNHIEEETHWLVKLMELIIMLLELVYKLVTHIKAN